MSDDVPPSQTTHLPNEVYDLVVSLFRPQERANPSLLQLADHVEFFARARTLRARMDALVNLYAWLRKRDDLIVAALSAARLGSERDAAWNRASVWLSVLEASREIRDCYHAGIASILDETDGVSLFAQSGLPNDRGVVAEAFDRISRIVLPAPREDHELAKLLLRLFPTDKEVQRFLSLPPDQLSQIIPMLVPVEMPEAWDKPVASLLDSLCLLAIRVQGLGLSENLRVRSQRGQVQRSPFYRMAHSADALIEALRTREGIAQAAQLWKSTVVECRTEVATIVSHLDEHGVNLDVVYAMDVIQKTLTRMEVISGVLVSPPGLPKQVTALRLVRDLIRGRIHDRSLVGLIEDTFRLQAKKIVEWAGRTGGHYITNTREEYKQMWRAAMGGGLLTVGTAAIKLMVTNRGFPPFVEGTLAGLNYSVSFILMQHFHLALATKQPSMTGAALASVIHRCKDVSKSDELVNYVQRITRSQLAAALGNILAVGVGAVAFSLVWRWIYSGSFLPVETAEYAVKSLNPLRSGTIIFAILTGVILWLSSLAGGWIENWAVYHRLPRAIAEHRLGSSFKPETVLRIADSISDNIAAWGGSIALGFMLAMTPELGHFFGLPLDVRHVTLSTGTAALGITSRGMEVLGRGALIMAGLGIAVTFVMNLGVSFYLALRLALVAQEVSNADHLEILRTLGRRFRKSPREFFLPPAADAPLSIQQHGH